MNNPAGLAEKEGSWASSTPEPLHLSSPAFPEVGGHPDVLEGQALKDGCQGQLESLAQGDG